MNSSPRRPAAVVSVDVDPVDSHLAGYGIAAPHDPSVYTVAIPRLIELFSRAGVTATFFLIGRDAAAHPESADLIARSGHEVASHSHTHPVPFARLGGDALRAEVVDSRRELERSAGVAVEGFRAPNWDLGPRVLAALGEAGYRYDASLYPTLLLPAARLLLALKSRDPRAAIALGLLPPSWRRAPYRVGGGEGIWEFPITVTPGLRLPLYHTARYVTPGDRFLRWIGGPSRRGEPLFYPLHAVDALGLAEDSVDPRLARHPGMDRPLSEKLALLEASLAAIVAGYRPMTYSVYRKELTAQEIASARPHGLA